ncbi:MAG: nuclear transport factor 2 family protein [Pseudomonadota bacterium]
MSDLAEVISAYGAAWQETNSEQRLSLLDLAWADDGRYSDPTADVSGRQNLSDHIGHVLASSNGGRVELTSATNTHHDVAHFTWRMVAPDGSVMVSGHDFVQFAGDGRIARLAGFFGDPEPL